MKSFRKQDIHRVRGKDYERIREDFGRDRKSCNRV